MKQVYGALLKLYPYDYQVAFGAEMRAAFATVAAGRHYAEMAALLVGIAAEWTAKLTCDSAIRARTLPDLRMMRPAGMPRELWFGRTEC